MAATKAALAVAETGTWGTCSSCLMIRRQGTSDDGVPVTVEHRTYRPVPDGLLPGRMLLCPGSRLPPLDLAPAFSDEE